MTGLWQDVRDGARNLRHRPAITTVMVVTLALGIGANTAIFTVVNSVLLEPLPYENPDRLVALFLDEGRSDNRLNPTSPANFMVWRESRTLERMTAAHPWSPALTGRGHPDQLRGLRASASLFDLLGARALIGRTFSPDEDLPGAQPVIVLGHGLWQRRFGGDASLIGQSLVLDGEPHTVVGVMPPDFGFPPFWATEAEMWVPLVLEAEDAASHSRHLRTFARLRPGVTLAEARAEMDRLQQGLRESFPRRNAGTGVNVESLREPVVGKARPALLILLGTVGLVLLIACANVANLLLARATVRLRELAIRAALGASRGRIGRQLLVESVMLALVAGGLGYVLAYGGVRALGALGSQSVPRLSEIGFDTTVFVFTLSLSSLTALLFGVVPAWRGSRTAIDAALKEGSRQRVGRAHSGLRKALVVSEVALSVALLTGAGLLVRSYVTLQQLDPGFRKQGLLTMTVSLAGSSLDTHERQTAFLEQTQGRVESLPGVEAAAFVNHLPLGGDIWSRNYVLEGRPVPSPDKLPRASLRVATTGYFEAMGIPLVRGRSFDARDTADSMPVVVVNEKLARRAWPDARPVGKRIRIGSESDRPWLTVIGVVGDVRQWDLTDDVRPEIYFPYSQNPTPWWQRASLVVHSSAPPAALAKSVQESVWELDSSLPVTDVRTMSQILADDTGSQRFETSLLGLFAALALALAAAGLYGVISYDVSQRTAEIGLRMAVGAQPGHIARLIVGGGLRLALGGLAIGLLGAAAGSELLRSMLFGVSTTDPTTFLGVPAVLLGVALLASYLPARQAMRVDPLSALRRE